jgi:serine protease Do
MSRFTLLAAAATLAAACVSRGRVEPEAAAGARARTLTLGGAGYGALGPGDPTLSDGSLYQAWTFWGTAAQRVQIDVVSNDFDAYAILTDGAGNELARDDDGGEGTDARIIHTLPANGQYRVLATSFRARRTGSYSVRLAPAVAVAVEGGTGVMGSITRGQTVSGTLTAADARLSDGSAYQAWLFQGRAGETIVVEVRSRDFDAYAIIQDGNGNRIASDDDSGGGTNARLRFTLTYTGTFRILANSFRQGTFGAYTLSVR